MSAAATRPHRIRGLVAIVTHDGSPIDAADLARLADSFTELRGEGERATVGENTSAGVVLLGPGRIERAGGGWTVVTGVAHSSRPLAEAALEDLDGQFALVRRDAGGNVIVASDPFAMQALYVADHNGSTYVSTSALALARHLRTAPDRFNLLSFLRAGYHFGTATNWVGVERLDPAMELRFENGRVERRLYWRPERDPTLAALPFQRMVDHCAGTAVETCHRYLAAEGRPWVDLTGGYDTRLLALVLREAGIDFPTNTRGDSSGADRRIAQRLARIAGWELTDLTVPAEWHKILPAMMPIALAWADGGLEVLELSWVLWAHALLAKEVPRLLIGGGGEHYRGFAWRQEFLQAGKSTEVNVDNWLDMRMLHPMDLSLFSSDPTSDVRSDMWRRMERWVEPYSDQLNTTQLDVLYAYKVTGHFGTYRSADGAFLDAQLPFYFKPIFTAAFSSNHRHRDNHRLMRHLIVRLDPRIASVETSTGGPAEPWRATNLHRFVPYYGQLARRALAKLAQRMPGRPLLAITSGSWYCPATARRAALEYLGGGGVPRAAELRSAALYNPVALDALFDRAAHATFSETTVLGRVITTELALQAVDAAL